ncbi:unnamed protein product [Mytilus edulis]|uniref:DZIP3-like HEPN domain-containing protein n=1 Tax=Mytilus edulis TaxID=6550 RepID=A0A8S3QTE3_MYTED|nr:unnamed protein product [Mytilus edulis]
MSNVNFEKKWECGHTKPESVTGSNDFFSEEQITEYYCVTCTCTPIYIGEWQDLQKLSKSCENDPGLNPTTESISQVRTTSSKTKKAVHCQTDQENHDCKKERDIPGFEIIFSTKVHTASTASLDHNLEETSSTSVLPIINKKQVVKESFTADELNFAKLGKIALNVLRDALYDRLKLDKDGDTSYTMPNKSDSDITSLYKEHRVLNTHVPSKSSTRPKSWGGKWTDIAIIDTCIGDDIERIRLTRNELQHAKSFSIDDVRYKELCVILQDVLNRFDQINKPSPLYTKRMNDVLLMELNRDNLEKIKYKLEHSLKRKTGTT